MRFTYQGVRTFAGDNSAYLIPIASAVLVFENKNRPLSPSSYARYSTATDFEWGISNVDEYSIGEQPGQILLAHSILVHEYKRELGLEAAEALADELANTYKNAVISHLNRSNQYSLDGPGTYIEWSMPGDSVRKFVQSVSGVTGSIDEWVTGRRQEQK